MIAKREEVSLKSYLLSDSNNMRFWKRPTVETIRSAVARDWGRGEDGQVGRRGL